MKSSTLLRALLGAILLTAMAVGLSFAASPKFRISTEFAVINDDPASSLVNVDFFDNPTAGNLTYSVANQQLGAAPAELTFNLANIAQIPTGFNGRAEITSDKAFHAEYRLHSVKTGFWVHSFATTAGTFEVRYVKAGAVAKTYTGPTLDPDGKVHITDQSFPPPAGGFDEVLIGSTVAVEGYHFAPMSPIQR